MNVKKIITEVKIYSHQDELSESDRNLLKKAYKAADKAYAPYSEFYVGAALLLENGKIITGNNQENVAYPSGLCAERVAVFNAGALYPDVPINTIAIVAKTNRFELHQPVSPCGACRQVIAEYENRHHNKIRIVLKGQTDEVWVVEGIKTLLPLIFDEKGLKRK